MLALLWRSAQSSNTSHSKMSADVEAAKPGQDGSGKVAINKGMNDSRHRKRPSMKPTDFLQTAAEGPPLRRSLSADHLPLGHLPLVSTKIHQHATPEPRLLHPILTKISITTRFMFNGLLSNVLFMLCYNWCVEKFTFVAPPTMYSIVYLVFIPIGHALVSLLVFGWPEKYIPSLLSNFPIGLTAIGLGGGLTAYLDSIQFNEMTADYVHKNFNLPNLPSGSEGEFYSSIVVLIVTSLWTYVLSIYVNSPPEKSEKKEL